MDVIVVGLTLKRAPLDRFEALRGEARLERLEQRVRAVPGVVETIRLATCHRIEFIAGVRGRADGVVAAVRRVVANACGSDVDASYGPDAFRHLVRLASGLDSPLLGESEILGQLRAAYATAVERGRAGRILNPLLHRVFRAARRVRGCAGWDRAVPSWGELLADAIATRSQPGAGRSIRLRGTGALARSLSLSLRARGFAIEDVAGEARILVTASGRGLLVSAAEVEAAAPLEIWDFGVPRNVDPSAVRIPGVSLHTLSEVLAYSEGAASSGSEASARAEAAVNAEVARFKTWQLERGGRVSLVGAGPGEPELLTVRAAARLADADVVYYDALVDRAVLDHCAPGARLVPVGKRRGAWSVSQEEIESALIKEARAGLSVVRLKGGDPFVFGRGSEEALALVRAGVPFEIVPGLSAGVAVPALAGIPLTHRGLSGSAAFVTAHDLGDSEAGDGVRQRIAHLAHGADTLVIFMAGAELDRLRATLLDAGLPAETPAALVESGGTAAQRIVTGTVDGLTRLGEGRGEGPVLIVIGRTVGLSETLREGATSRTRAGREMKIRRAG